MLLALLIFSTSGIGIPLNTDSPRCMAVYSYGDSETIKIDVRFPDLLGYDQSDEFEISWLNTDDNSLQTETTRGNIYKK